MPQIRTYKNCQLLSMFLQIKIQKIPRMNNKLKTASSLSQDSTQVRYQKALKQITKLIGVNTEIRQEIGKYQYEKLDIGVYQYNKLSAEKAEIQAELQAVSAQKMQIHKQNQQLKKQINKLRNLKVSSQSHIRKKQTRDSYFDTEKMTEYQRTIQQLQKILDMRNQTIKQLSKKIKNNSEQSPVQNGHKNMYSEVIKTNINNNQLNKKLHVANDYIDKVSEENVNLKSRLIKAESKNKLLNARSMEALVKYSPQISPRNSVFTIQSRNSEEVLKRYHKLQEQNKKYSKKFQHMKDQITQLTEQNTKLKKQNTKFLTQTAGYQKLITKQQQIIAQLHSDYQNDVTRMTAEFKQKLIEQRQSFSPAKTADQLNKIDTLQSQNKTLKKKFQLCSIELTKCFKTLQIYKVKLNQCEKDYLTLVNQREQLADKLSRLQNSHRQKSIHSRGSASRIIDNDRRNSMGETGHFNFS